MSSGIFFVTLSPSLFCSNKFGSVGRANASSYSSSRSLSVSGKNEGTGTNEGIGTVLGGGTLIQPPRAESELIALRRKLEVVRIDSDVREIIDSGLPNIEWDYPLAYTSRIDANNSGVATNKFYGMTALDAFYLNPRRMAERIDILGDSSYFRIHCLDRAVTNQRELFASIEYLRGLISLVPKQHVHAPLKRGGSAQVSVQNEYRYLVTSIGKRDFRNGNVEMYVLAVLNLLFANIPTDSEALRWSIDYIIVYCRDTNRFIIVFMFLNPQVYDFLRKFLFHYTGLVILEHLGYMFSCKEEDILYISINAVASRFVEPEWGVVADHDSLVC